MLGFTVPGLVSNLLPQYSNPESTGTPRWVIPTVAPANRQSRFDMQEELRLVASGFESSVSRLRSESAMSDRGIRPTNIAVALPFLLIEGIRFEGDRDAARAMSLGNAFATAHFLSQDGLLDGTTSARPRALGFCDRCLAEFVRLYGELLPRESDFWQHYDRFMDEYFSSLEWELSIHHGDGGVKAVGDDELDRTLLLLGRKMSPLKVTAAAVATLGGRPDLLPGMERLIEEYHAGYQLADDLVDLREDLEAHRPSATAWMLLRWSGRTELPEELSARGLMRMAVESGALKRVTGTMESCYARALSTAEELPCPELAEFLGTVLHDTAFGNARMTRRLSLEARAARTDQRSCSDPNAPEPHGSVARAIVAARELHTFDVAEKEFAFDPASGFFFEADAVARDTIRWLRRRAPEAERAVLELNHGAASIRTGISEVAGLAPDAKPRGDGGQAGPIEISIKSLALNVSNACNLSCTYCYLGAATASRRGNRNSEERLAGDTMSEDVAFRAVDVLMRESFGEPEVSIVFFGGEPLLATEMLRPVVRYARERAAEVGRQIHFHMTTNGTLLRSSTAKLLAELGIDCLVSMDGCEKDHDANRCFPNGEGSYAHIARNLAELPPDFDVGVRATITESSGALTALVEHLTGLGFSMVHLAPVSGTSMGKEFALRLCSEFEALAESERDALLNGSRPSVSSFTEPMALLAGGFRRSSPCGAGARYLSVATDGTLYLCHRFAGDSRFAVGHVAGGIDRGAITSLLRRLRAASSACRDCWARDLCGGPCYHDLETMPEESVGHDAVRCSVRKRIIELSMWLYAELPEEQRKRLRGRARRESRREGKVGDRPRVETSGKTTVREGGDGVEAHEAGERHQGGG